MVKRVFITQENSTVNYSLAIPYGDLVFITAARDRLSPQIHSINNKDIVDRIKNVLKDFDEDDYLLCTGAPAHMAISGSILGNKLKHLLVWDNRDNRYFEVQV